MKMQWHVDGQEEKFFFSSRRRHTRYWRDWSSDVCSSDLTTLRKLGADAVVVGECEEVLPMLAAPRADWHKIPSLGTWVEGHVHVTGPTAAANKIGRASCRERV